jgi:hypothetical protein
VVPISPQSVHNFTFFYLLTAIHPDFYLKGFDSSNQHLLLLAKMANDQILKDKRYGIRNDIRRLVHKVEAHKSEFFEPNNLSELGIHALQMPLLSAADGGERVQFNPCYFEPLSQQIIRDHPITDPKEDGLVPLSYLPEEEEYEGSNENTEEDMDDLWWNDLEGLLDPYERAEHIRNHIYSYLDSHSRDGLEPLGQQLWNFSPFECG